MTRVDHIQIQYKLTFQTPFHCGTGIRVGLIDRTVVRDANDYLYVPGSTFKGIVREHSERLARLYAQGDKNMYDLIGGPYDDKLALYGLGHQVSMITRIFGSQNHPGHLFFEDAHQSKKDKNEYEGNEKWRPGKYKNLQTDLYTQVRLDRPTRTSVPGALYTSEFGIKDLSVEGNITGWLDCTPIDELQNGPSYSLLLLLAGLLIVDRVGGNKSAGKGQCTCTITSLKIGEHSYEVEEWHLWLDRLDLLEYYSFYALLEEDEA